MAGKVSARVVMNRKALDAIRGGFVDGMAAMGAAILAKAHPPDDDPIGVGLVHEGGWGVWADGKKVATSPSEPVQRIEESVSGGSFGHAVKVHRARKVGGAVTLPRGLKVKQGITLVVGFGFPARFNELGTIHQPARPFFTPVVMETIPGMAEDFLKSPVRRALLAR
jgi:hypothetical protein